MHNRPILVVDDNEVNRIFLESTLRRNGFTNILALDNAKTALQKLAAFQPDIVILDIVMPGMDGYECCREIRKSAQYKNLPVLMQTVITEPELRVKAFNSGATDFISKPIYPDELCARVRVHLGNRLSLQFLQFYKERVETELQAARELQLSVLPADDELKYLKTHAKLDIASHFQPASEIGGDFWGVKMLPSGFPAIWLVDFSGHGVSSALNSFRLQAYLKEHSEIMDSPGGYLTQLNKKLLLLLQRGQFATMFYGIIDTKEKLLRYACGCAPSPIILHGKLGMADIIDGSGTPLGISEQNYATQTVSFEKGDTLLLYSDALMETANAAGDYLTEDDIANALLTVRNTSAENIMDVSRNLFAQHVKTAPKDDLTLVAVRRM